MTKRRNGFTMIEVVFVIVVLGILASIAIPRFAATRTDAEISKGRADVAAVRSAIVSERQSRLITGDTAWINSLGSGFSNVLMYEAGDKWTGAGPYTYTLSDGTAITFTYNNADGTFRCTSGCSHGFSDFQ